MVKKNNNPASPSGFWAFSKMASRGERESDGRSVVRSIAPKAQAAVRWWRPLLDGLRCGVSCAEPGGLTERNTCHSGCT